MRVLAGLILWLLSGVQVAVAQQPIAIRFSHNSTVDSPKGRAVEFFKMRAESLTKGRVRIDIYPNAQAFTDAEEFAGLQRGDVELLAPSLSRFTTLGATEFEVFDVPYMFPTRTSLKLVQEGPVGLDLLKRLSSKGMLGLTYWDNGFKVMSANKPFLMPTDLKGLRMRVQPSRMLEAEMKALGAVPVGLPLAQAYKALQSGQVDGTENPPANMYTQRMNEVQRYVVETEHGYLGYAVVANLSFWNGLPSDVRAGLDKAIKESTRYANAIAWQDNTDALAVIARSGKTTVTRLTAAQRREWQKALEPVQREAEARLGAELVRSVARAAAGN